MLGGQDVRCVEIGHSNFLVDFDYFMVFNFHILLFCDYLMEILVCHFFCLRLVPGVVVSVLCSVVASLVVSLIGAGSKCVLSLIVSVVLILIIVVVIILIVLILVISVLNRLEGCIFILLVAVSALIEIIAFSTDISTIIASPIIESSVIGIISAEITSIIIVASVLDVIAATINIIVWSVIALINFHAIWLVVFWLMVLIGWVGLLCKLLIRHV